MITYKAGDIFESYAHALVCPVNCAGVAKEGLALQFKNRFPLYFEDYHHECQQNLLKPGRIHTFNSELHYHPCWIMSFPTKNHWRFPSHLHYIESGMDALIAEIFERRIRSISIPALGCGLGELNWGYVQRVIEWYANQAPDTKFLIYHPQNITVSYGPVML